MRDKIVYYHLYCERCINAKRNEQEEPCNECLLTSMREDSHKPIHFEPNENVKS